MLVVDQIRLEGRHATLVPPTSLHVPSGTLALVQGESQLQRTALGLLLSGRMKPDGGRISWDGHSRTIDLRRASCLVDAPGVNEPEPHVRVRDLVKEDLALVPSFTWHRVLPMSWLGEYHQDDIADRYVEALDPADRLDLMVNLALADPAVHLVICDSPERHGASDDLWLERLGQIVTDHERDVTVVAVVSVTPAGWNGALTRIGQVELAHETDLETPATLTSTTGDLT